MEIIRVNEKGSRCSYYSVMAKDTIIVLREDFLFVHCTHGFRTRFAIFINRSFLLLYNVQSTSYSRSEVVGIFHRGCVTS